MAWTQEKILEVAKSIQDKALADTAFRTRFKADPNAVVEELSGLQLPAGFKISVIDEEDTNLSITLPRRDPAELSDMELEAVAGGKNSLKQDFEDLGHDIEKGAKFVEELGEGLGEVFKGMGIVFYDYGMKPMYDYLKEKL